MTSSSPLLEHKDKDDVIETVIYQQEDKICKRRSKSQIVCAQIFLIIVLLTCITCAAGAAHFLYKHVWHHSLQRQNENHEKHIMLDLQSSHLSRTGLNAAKNFTVQQIFDQNVNCTNQGNGELCSRNSMIAGNKTSANHTSEAKKQVTLINSNPTSTPPFRDNIFKGQLQKLVNWFKSLFHAQPHVAVLAGVNSNKLQRGNKKQQDENRQENMHKTDCSKQKCKQGKIRKSRRIVKRQLAQQKLGITPDPMSNIDSILYTSKDRRVKPPAVNEKGEHKKQPGTLWRQQIPGGEWKPSNVPMKDHIQHISDKKTQWLPGSSRSPGTATKSRNERKQTILAEEKAMSPQASADATGGIKIVGKSPLGEIRKELRHSQKRKKLKKKQKQSTTTSTGSTVTATTDATPTSTTVRPSSGPATATVKPTVMMAKHNATPVSLKNSDQQFIMADKPAGDHMLLKVDHAVFRASQFINGIDPLASVVIALLMVIVTVCLVFICKNISYACSQIKARNAQRGLHQTMERNVNNSARSRTANNNTRKRAKELEYGHNSDIDSDAGSDEYILFERDGVHESDKKKTSRHGRGCVNSCCCCDLLAL